MEVLDVDANPSLLRRLKNDIVMVGLNVARPFSEPFRNFHDDDGKANDFRLRHAFTETPYYGAYMTDVIKNHAEVERVETRRIPVREPDGRQGERQLFP